MDPMELCQRLPPATMVIFYVLYATLEWFMGKTKFGSMIGLAIETPIAKVLKKLGIQK